ncbi:MAG: hypothetical protein ABUJ98_13190, partial [Hyphomicrobium sp.]
MTAANPAATGEAAPAGEAGTTAELGLEPKATPEPTGDAKPTGSWRDALSDERREHPSLKDYKDVDGLAKSHIEQSKLIGEKRLVIPRDDAPETWEAYHKAGGRPD